MSGRTSAPRFAARPSDPDAWIKERSETAAPPPQTDRFTARLTIDITPELRGRIKVIAFQSGITVADMLRALLAREYGNYEGAPS